MKTIHSWCNLEIIITIITSIKFDETKHTKKNVTQLSACARNVACNNDGLQSPGGWRRWSCIARRPPEVFYHMFLSVVTEDYMESYTAD